MCRETKVGIFLSVLLQGCLDLLQLPANLLAVIDLMHRLLNQEKKEKGTDTTAPSSTNKCLFNSK
jgi:hypothetical protein